MSSDSQRAAELHRRATVVDTHCDTILSAVKGERHLGDRSEKGHLDFPRMVEGGVSAQFFAAYIEPQYKPDRGLERSLQVLDVLWREVEASSAVAEVALSVADIRRISAAGRVAVVIAIEGGEAVGHDLANLRMLYRLGVRSLGLVWNQRNLIADGVGERRTGGGLTNFGVAVVEEMNRLGMLVDVSHLSDPGFWHVAETCRGPFAATHSNARAVCDHPRNLTDDQLKALARSGGVTGLNFAPAFVSAENADVSKLIDHLDHIVQLVGPDHVGLGSDFDGISTTPRGLEDVRAMPRITEELVARGYGDEDILKFLGGNHLRVLKEVWRG
ncbi:MAG: peptidase [Firmicutes bacterium RBG_13_65_8]|nr:MAG: peptidase [Firmicutes bacterium RBG_13_65_8]